MTDSPVLVCVVDDDISVREALAGLISSAGWAAEVFASAHEFLAKGCAFSCPTTEATRGGYHDRSHVSV